MSLYETTHFDRRHAGQKSNGHRTPDYRADRHLSDRYRAHDRDLLTAVSDAARQNPMSAALIGMGALWLFMGGNRVSLLGGDGKSSLVGSVAHGTGTVAHGAAHAASRAGEAVSSTVASAASGIAGTVSDAASRVSDAASRATDYVSGHLQGVDAQSAYLNSGVGGYRGAYGSGHHRDRYAPITTLRENLQDLFERHPIALGIAGLAIGAGVAASLPVTEKERETLGKAGEAVRHQVAETAGQVKEAAQAAVDEVKSASRRPRSSA